MEQTATRAGGAAMAQPTRGTSLVPGDRIVVTLTATKPNKERISISEVFDHNGVNIDNGGVPTGRGSLEFVAAGGAEPAFPLAAYKEALKAENEDTASSLVKTYRTQLENFQRTGGSTMSERIGSAVFAWLGKTHGVSEAEGDHLILKRENVVAKAPIRASQDEPGVWLLQLAPTWGC